MIMARILMQESGGGSSSKEQFIEKGKPYLKVGWSRKREPCLCRGQVWEQEEQEKNMLIMQLWTKLNELKLSSLESQISFLGSEIDFFHFQLH